jgi:hypothetical protein
VRRLLLAAAAGLCLALLLGSGGASGAEPPGKKAPPGKPNPIDKLLDKEKEKDGCKEGCARHNTRIDFYKTPHEAAEAALKEEKLVFVLHLSGIFENSEFT